MSLAVLQGANLVARFALELSALAALALWGFTLGVPVAVRVLAGVGAPVVAAVVWGLFASPRAAVALPSAARLAVQALVLGAAVAALVQAGRPQLASAFGLAAAVNAALLVWWQQ
ncbi:MULTISPECIES: DUF2568 domain-containing protein [unclassified Blastococcus]